MAVCRPGVNKWPPLSPPAGRVLKNPEASQWQTATPNKLQYVSSKT